MLRGRASPVRGRVSQERQVPARGWTRRAQTGRPTGRETSCRSDTARRMVQEASLNTLALAVAMGAALFAGLTFLFARRRGGGPALPWWGAVPGLEARHPSGEADRRSGNVRVNQRALPEAASARFATPSKFDARQR